MYGIILTVGGLDCLSTNDGWRKCVTLALKKIFFVYLAIAESPGQHSVTFQITLAMSKLAFGYFNVKFSK